MIDGQHPHAVWVCHAGVDVELNQSLIGTQTWGTAAALANKFAVPKIGVPCVEQPAAVILLRANGQNERVSRNTMLIGMWALLIDAGLCR